jgi:hypothetical protein
MLRKVLLLLVVGTLLIGIQAYAKTFELSPAQMEEAKGGCWALCDNSYNCLGGIGCQAIWPNASKLLQPYLVYTCRPVLYNASCSIINPNAYCGKIIYYGDTITCNGEHIVYEENHYTGSCGLYP